MKLKNMFRCAVEAGFKADPRGKAGVKKFLEREKKRQAQLSDPDKRFADSERLWNPYADTRILHGTGEEEVKHLFVGIDTETEEMVLVDRLRSEGKRIDAVMGHHPEGRALHDLDQVMAVQVDILKNLGVPENRAEHLLESRRAKIRNYLHARNFLRIERAAELLDIPYFNCHNPADHLAAQFIYKKVLNKEYDTVGEIVKKLESIPEYADYAKRGNPPIAVVGSAAKRAGKTVVFGFNGGTNGPPEFIEELSAAGVGTYVCMHINEEDRKMAQKHHLNVIQCSHMASDSLGMNLVLDVLKKKEPKLKVIEGSGFIRIER